MKTYQGISGSILLVFKSEIRPKFVETLKRRVEMYDSVRVDMIANQADKPKI